MSAREKGRRIAVWGLTGLTLFLALGLCWAILDLWREGQALRQADPAAVIYSPEAVRTRARWLAPLLALWLAALAAALCLGKRKRRQSAAPRPGEPTAPAPEAKGLRRLRLVMLAAALALIVLGVLNGGLRDVLVKAVNLCTECIGLG